MKNVLRLNLISFLLFTGLTANAQNWKQTNNAPSAIKCMALVGSNIFVGSNKGIQFSSDMGAKWEIRFSKNAISLISNGTDIFAGTSGGLFKSADMGITWLNLTPKGMKLSDTAINAMLIKGPDIFIGTGGSGIFKSPLKGISNESWTAFSKNIPGDVFSITQIRSLAVCGSNILAGTAGLGVWISPATEANWVASAGMGTNADYINALAVNGTTVFAGNFSGTPRFYQSSNSGANWEPTSLGSDQLIESIAVNGNITYVGCSKEGAFISKNNGKNWEPYIDGFKDSVGNWHCKTMGVNCFAFLGNKILAGTICSVWISEDGASGSAQNLSDNHNILVYPNPSKGKISIKSEIENSAIEIMNTLGEKIYSAKLNRGETKIDINNNPKGIYFYQVKRENTILKTGRIISE